MNMIEVLERLRSAYQQQRDIFYNCHVDALGRFRDSDDEADVAEMDALLVESAGAIERAVQTSRLLLELVYELDRWAAHHKIVSPHEWPRSLDALARARAILQAET